MMSALIENPFLLVLDTAIRRDQASAGFQGDLAIGVLKGTLERWWVCTFGRRVHAHFASSAPEKSSASLLLSHRDAEGLIKNHRRPISPISLSGDRTIIKRFVRRYLHQQNMLSLRSSGGARCQNR